MIMTRRSLLTGAVATIFMPAVVKAEFLMPVKKIIMPIYVSPPYMPWLRDGFPVLVGYQNGNWYTASYSGNGQSSPDWKLWPNDQ